MRSVLIALVAAAVGVLLGSGLKSARDRIGEIKTEAGIYSAEFDKVTWMEPDGQIRSGSVLSLIRSDAEGRKVKVNTPVEAKGGKLVYVSGCINGTKSDMVIELYESKEE